MQQFAQLRHSIMLCNDDTFVPQSYFSPFEENEV
jgi:hypothetical protein